MPTPYITLNGGSLTIEDVVRIARESGARARLDPGARTALVASRRLVERAIESGRRSTGSTRDSASSPMSASHPTSWRSLQVNLIRSHAAGVGTPLSPEVVRAIMLLRANVLLRATSGVRPELVEALLAMLNAGIVPLVPEQGSVGASGDLAPLSHIALALIGEGEVLGATRAPSRRLGHSRCRAGSVPLRSKGRPGVHQRHPGPDCPPGAAGARCRGAVADGRRGGGDEPGGASRHAGAAGSPHPRGAAAPGPARGRRPDAWAARRQRDPGVAPGGRSEGPGRLLPALHPAGIRRGGGRDPLRSGDRRPSSSTPPPTIRWCFPTAMSCLAATSTASRSRRRSISWRPPSPLFRRSPSGESSGW